MGNVRTIRWATPTIGTAALLFISIAGSVNPAHAILTHLYTFNDGTARDSVGNAHGMLLGDAFIDLDGRLHLPGGPNDFVSLDGPAIDIASYTDVTFEAWFTVNQHNTWQRVFDFGDRTVPAGQQGYVYYTPQGGGGGGLAVYATGGQRTEAPHDSLQTGHEYHLAMVIDSAANGGSNLLTVYLDGIEQASVSHNRSLSNVGTTFAYLGESLVADPNFNGSMTEFRIHNNAFDLGDVQASFAAGPTPQAELRLEVNTVTGAVSILGDDAASVTFDYYLMTSEAGALDPDGWFSLDEQELDAIGAGAGESWRTGEVDSSQLVELFLLGASTIDDVERLELGQAFDPSIFGLGVDGDVSFRYSSPGSQVLRAGEVVYVTPEPLDGDYNGDQVVDAADYTAWRDTGGAAAGFNTWKWSFGTAGGAAGVTTHAAAVPEPAAIVLIVSVVICAASSPNRSRRKSRR